MLRCWKYRRRRKGRGFMLKLLSLSLAGEQIYNLIDAKNEGKINGENRSCSFESSKGLWFTKS